MKLGNFASLATAVVLAAGSCLATAQSYPSRPIRIVQGFAPGGNADTIARVLGGEMAKGLGQPLVVEARPGAGGNLASDAVAKAQPDGYTLLLAVGGHSVSGALYKTLAYRSVEDFAWISTATVFPFLVSVRNDYGAKTLKQLLAMAKAKADAVSYGTAGVGSTQHLTGELLASMGGVRILHVPYKGDAGAVTAILSGEINFTVTPATAALPHIQSGRMRVLAVTGGERWRGLPNVPTVHEAGVKGFDVGSWAGLATTAGTPREVVYRLNAELRRALEAPEVRSRLEAFGGEVRSSTPEEMRNRVASEVARWSKVIAAEDIERR
jgi:tripartite-type tricarboxylate transporter receptor subunit TctC